MYDATPCHGGLTAAEELEKWRLGRIAGDRTVYYCDAGQQPHGAIAELTSSGDPVTLYLVGGPGVGTLELECSGTITQNAKVYPGQDGKITAIPFGKSVGIALQAGTDGVVIEVLPAMESVFGNDGDVHGIEDDFMHYIDADDWTLVASDSGGAAVGDAVGGVLTLSPSDGTVTDNDESYLNSTAETFKFAADKPIYFQARVTQTEANTDDANWLVGLMDAVAADALVDDGAGPKASYSGAVFFKVDGGTVVQAECSVGATQVTDTDVGEVTSGTQMKLEIYWIPTSATSATCYFYFNGTLGAEITHTYTGATEMQIVFGAKNGSANHDTLLIDYVKCVQVR